MVLHSLVELSRKLRSQPLEPQLLTGALAELGCSALCLRRIPELICQIGEPRCPTDLELPSSPLSLEGGGLAIGRTDFYVYFERDSSWSDEARLGAEMLAELLFWACSPQPWIQANKMLAVGQMAAGVAHELNTPLGAVSLAIEAAQFQMASNPKSAAEKLETGLRAAERAQSIVDKLLTYSRRSDEHSRRVDLNAIVADALEFISHRVEGAAVQLDYRPGPPVWILGRSQDLQQVVMNLVLNAIDAGSPVVTVELAEEGEKVVLAVQDVGSGIAEENLARLFEPFFTTKPVGQGTGLGLSVCREIVKAHAGEIDVHSVVGEGTRVTVRLPRG